MAEILLLFFISLISYCAPQGTIPPSCSSNVYCKGPLLHRVQMARIFPDSKTFVDLRMFKSENETLADFNDFLNATDDNPTKAELERFVNEHFEEGKEFVDWFPTDYNPNPPILNTIKDKNFREFAKDLVEIWPLLARKVSPAVAENPDRFSLISIPNGFVIPGGRFKEIYYWDSYWIIEGLISSDMTETARGVIENFLYLVKKFGHIPNGSRVYYSERSQPPLLTAMVVKYVKATSDVEWLKNNIETLEEELNFWRTKRLIEIEINGEKYEMLRYAAESEGPRPESYFEDYTFANELNNARIQQDFYTDVKSAAESGWDFSSRWFINSEGVNSDNLTDVNTRKIIPVDLNSIYASAAEIMGNFYGVLGYKQKSQEWWDVAEKWRKAIDAVLWNDEDGVWYDYNIGTKNHTRNFHPSNVAPLWMKCVDAEKLSIYGPKVVNYLKRTGALTYPGGIPATLWRTGEQWDFPNAWPPLQSMIVQALSYINSPESNRLALETAQKWVRANYKGYSKHNEMFEKYDAETPGEYGGGGEYVVQSGFGWSNGVIFEMLSQYGDVLTSED